MDADTFSRVLALDAWITGAHSWHAGPVTLRLHRQLVRSRRALCGRHGLIERPYLT